MNYSAVEAAKEVRDGVFKKLFRSFFGTYKYFIVNSPGKKGHF